MSNTLFTESLTHVSRETLLAILEALPTTLFLLDDSGTILSANARTQELTGAPPEEIIGKPLAQILWWSGSPAAREQLHAALAQAHQGGTVNFQTTAHPWNGGDLDLEATITRYVDADDHRMYLIFAGINITARKQTDETISALIDTIPQFVWVMDPDGSARYSNRQWCDYTGKTPEQIQGGGWLQFIHPDDRSRVQKAWQASVYTGTPYEVEHRIQEGSTGDYRWFLARSLPQRDAQGTIVRWIGTCTDINEQKLAEERAKASEQNWRVLTETVPQLVWTMRADGLSDYFNQRFRDYTHATWEQLKGYGWSQFLHPDDAERTLIERERAFRTGSPYEIEYRFREGQTGLYRWFLVRAMPIHNDAGQVVRWFGTCTDIDEQKRTEEALRQSQERIHALINSNLIGIVSNEGEEEVLVEANETFLQMSGYSREDLDSRTLTRARIMAPEDAQLFECALQEIAAKGQHTPFETELLCKDGSRLPIFVGGVLFQNHPRQIISFVLDNSARRELEQRKDDFISMASHELRNPLTALKLQTTMLHRRLAKQDIQALTSALSNMDGQINTIGRLVEELLDVSKIQAGKLEYHQETVDLDALLQETTVTMQQIYPSHRILVRGAAQANLLGDRDRLGQVFTNLLSNAIKYSPDAESVEVELSTSPETINISVHDHGLGIPQEQREKIFERFYRATGPRQKAIPGLGMGLYIVAEIVKLHGGTITVDSTVGKGSTFTMTLPRC